MGLRRFVRIPMHAEFAAAMHAAFAAWLRHVAEIASNPERALARLTKRLRKGAALASRLIAIAPPALASHSGAPAPPLESADSS